ncbi:MAG: hypothetical protein M3R17_20905 [Bacteroidota bacterium]|nr:hypothetical protein [Bacteroidota bacterium]
MKNTFTRKNLVAAFCFLFAAHAANSQTIRLKEIMLNSFLSGNSFGVQRSISAGFLIGKRLEISGGPTFSRGFQKNTGEVMSVRYYVVRDHESYSGKLRLSSTFTLQRMHNQSLSQNAIYLEQQMAFNMKNDESTSFATLRYKGWEATAGIGSSYRFNFGMILRGEIGLSYYATTITNDNTTLHAFHDESGTSLRLGFGIGWALGRKITPQASAGERAAKALYLK